MTSPEEQRIVPLVADPAAGICVRLEIEAPAMPLVHGELVADKPRQDEFLVTQELVLRCILFLCDCFCGKSVEECNSDEAAAAAQCSLYVTFRYLLPTKSK